MIVTRMFGLFARQYLSFHMGKVLHKEDFLRTKKKSINMEEKSLTSQRLVYDAIHDGNAKLTDFQITPTLRKGCLLSHQQYKMELEKKVEEKQRSSTDLKCKMKHDKISNVKNQRVEIEATIQSSTDGIIKEALLADDKKTQHQLQKLLPSVMH